MATFLLVIIYITFISLGLPDSLLGSAWPVMQVDLSVPLPLAGVASMIITGGTIVSSLLSEQLIKRFGTGNLTFISVSMTAGALLCLWLSPSFVFICFAAIPLGLGAGAVDAGLNNFVALHYKSRHMSWLHCFWGVGATVGPIIMSMFIAQTGGWRTGYLTISFIQICLATVLLLTLPLWKTHEKAAETSESADGALTPKAVMKLPGIKGALLTFFFYSAVETTTGLWGSSFLAMNKGLSSEMAARCISMFFLGITLGRLITGFATIKLNNIILIRIGQFIGALGALALLLPLPIGLSMAGLILIGLGLAPIFPCMLQETPYRFGKEASQSIMGLQMAFAYTGSTFMPSIFGFLASRFTLIIFPVFILIYMLIMTLSAESINRGIAKNNKLS